MRARSVVLNLILSDLLRECCLENSGSANIFLNKSGTKSESELLKGEFVVWVLINISLFFNSKNALVSKELCKRTG